MSLLEYARIGIQRGWIIVLCALMAAGAMVVYSARQTPIYRATQVVLIQPARADLGISQANRNLLNSYVVYLNSSFVAQEIADELGLGVSGAELRGRAEIGAIPDRLTIEIEVNDTDGDRANLVAFTWGQKLVQYRQAINADLPADDHINVIVQDFPTYRLYRPRTLVNVSLGSITGGLVGFALVFALEFRRNRRVHTADDLILSGDDAPLIVSIPPEPAG